MLDLPSIRKSLANHQPQEPSASSDGSVSRQQERADHARTRQAAVAIVLRERDAETEMLFIKRAEKPGDPWSGHMAFPGGHREAGDVDLRAAAVRETHEEIGLDISSATMLGELPQQRPMSVRSNMLVAPFVFEIEGHPTLTLNHEVAATVWTPLAPMHGGRNLARSRPPFETDGGNGDVGTFSGFRLATGYFVWGMTYRMVQTFFETIDPAYRPLPD